MPRSKGIGKKNKTPVKTMSNKHDEIQLSQVEEADLDESAKLNLSERTRKATRSQRNNKQGDKDKKKTNEKHFKLQKSLSHVATMDEMDMEVDASEEEEFLKDDMQYDSSANESDDKEDNESVEEGEIEPGTNNNAIAIITNENYPEAEDEFESESGVIQFKTPRPEDPPRQSTSKQHDNEEEICDEELKFMERLAVFLEERDEKKRKENSGQAATTTVRLTQVVNEKAAPGVSNDTNRKRKIVEGKTSKTAQASQSESMIYKPAVRVMNEINDSIVLGIDKDLSANQHKRDSSSSEEMAMINTSDETEMGEDDVGQTEAIDNFLAERRERVEKSAKQAEQQHRQQPHRNYVNQEDKAAQIIRNAERAKARMMDVPGKNNNSFNPLNVQYGECTNEVNEINLINNNGDMIHSVMVDEQYSAVASHVKENLRRKIMLSEYIDFSRLLPSHHTNDEDERMELVNRGGISTWVLVRDCDVINSFARWEQAFRVFSNIYTEFFPRKASELIQYNNVINTASQSFAWDNVYRYDKDFRRHLSKHPGHSWAIILQQAWTMRLRDRNGIRFGNNSRGSERGRNKRDNICWKFNVGKCTYGLSCKFEHRCALCLKFGHGAHNCRRVHGQSGDNWWEDRETGERGGRRYNHYGGGSSARGNDRDQKNGQNKSDRFHYHKKEDKEK